MNNETHHITLKNWIAISFANDNARRFGGEALVELITFHGCMPKYVINDLSNPILAGTGRRSGGCPRRPLSRRRLRLLGPRQWLPAPCGGCPRRPLSSGSGSPASASFFRPGWLNAVGYGVYKWFFSSTFDFDSFDEIFLPFYYY